jgi:CHAT domain-containing protein
LELLEAQSKKLAAYLLDPIGPAIDAHEKLIVTPYGELNTLPFAALRWQGPWLGHQRTITYLPSASMLQALTRPASSAAQSILAVGNPRHMTHHPPFGDVRELAPLQYSEAEAYAVASLYDEAALTGAKASIDEVRPRLRAHRQLHFATHGVLYDEAPLLSGIALADGYVLTVQELMGIRLDADFVAVSACRSGLGARTGGEEIVGLSRGLLAAGARAVIVSLWSVPDPSTAVLMVRFHQNMRDGMEIAKALQQAESWLSTMSAAEFVAEKQKLRDLGQEEKLRDLGAPRVQPAGPAHPQFWAPFVVIGL